MEQLVENMPPELELCVSERKLKTVKETGKIVDDLCSGSKGDSAGDEVSQMWSKRSSSWELSNCREQCYSVNRRQDGSGSTAAYAVLMLNQWKSQATPKLVTNVVP